MGISIMTLDSQNLALFQKWRTIEKFFEKFVRDGIKKFTFSVKLIEIYDYAHVI